MTSFRVAGCTCAARTTHGVVHVYPLGRGAIHKFAANEQLRGGLSGGKREEGEREGPNSHVYVGTFSADSSFDILFHAQMRGCTLSLPSSLHDAAQMTHRLRAVRPQRHTGKANRTLANDVKRDTPAHHTPSASEDYLWCTHQKDTYSTLPRKTQLTLLFRILLRAAILTRDYTPIFVFCTMLIWHR